VQHSLDQTRQELKRGVFELPHETRESTAAMRRLVADQIKALAELNEVVNRHARGIDHAGPRRMAVNEDTLAGPAEARSTERPRSRLEAVSNRDRETIREIGREIEREVGRRPSRPEEERATSGDWFADTILRGRREEEPRRDSRPREVEPAAKAGEPQLRSIESLDALSADIARLVDHDASVEFWERHKRGEKGAFTRRLYTNQGQKTFEDIRRKYRRSSEFRETVDRYIEEFERLLEQVGRDDRGQVLTRTYLASDTGKVYTLLAHASGRLG
jgi:hypothetical protein